MAQAARMFGLAGWSGSGKTTLMVKLIPELTARGLSVSTVKSAHHDFDVDTPGKDSYEHRAAGATEVLVSSANRWALIHENRGAPEPALHELVARMSAVDLLLVEGFKADPIDKLEVHRPSVGNKPLHPEDPKVVAIASDEALPEATLPVFDLDDITGIADFIVAHCGLKTDKRGAA
jgi:molybdopterin-guanine dinucleotide biosynthesis protein B